MGFFLEIQVKTKKSRSVQGYFEGKTYCYSLAVKKKKSEVRSTYIG